MKVYHRFSDYVATTQSVVTIGMFDGVHIGHQKVIHRCTELAKNGLLNSVVITFTNHPASYFQGGFDIDLLTPENLKIKFIESLNVDILFLIPFDEFIANISANDFVIQILIEQLNCHSFVLGYDNRFGYNREGSIHFVNEKFHEFIASYEIEAEILDNLVISSSQIKQFLIEGKIDLANQMLGRNYTVNGNVIKGKQLGRTINFPTANLQLKHENQYLPSIGVYLTEIKLDDKIYFGLTNIGYRPTVDDAKKINIETFIFDFDKTIYGAEISLKFISKCREEIKFKNLESLKIQISKDVEWALNELTKIHVTS
jgi:riboflavin kinase/FMN adenylyltransferase